jgi:hypothetical protein
MKTDLLKLSPAEFCHVTDACPSGRAFALAHATMADVWDACPHVDWLCWILERLDVAPDERKVRGFMCWAATDTPLHDGRKTLDLLTDERSRNAVNVALRFAAWSAAWSAAESAAWSAAGAAAWSAAWSAAESAAAGAAAESAQADEFRRRFPNPFRS